MANPLAQQVGKILASTVGEFIAKATIKKNCELIGTSPDELRADQLPELAANIEKSISFFSGKEAGAEVSAKIQDLAR